jgi:hypothetical protein
MRQEDIVEKEGEKKRVERNGAKVREKITLLQGKHIRCAEIVREHNKELWRRERERKGCQCGLNLKGKKRKIRTSFGRSEGGVVSFFCQARS